MSESSKDNAKQYKKVPLSRVAVVGNAGGGKTTLSRRLAELYQLPLTHVDSIQFLPGMKIRPFKESVEILAEIQSRDTWLIDGYGPLDIIVKRFELAECVVFIDFPIWQHFWWCTKRQIQNLWSRRQELPAGCSEVSWSHTVKLYKSIWKAHKLMRPELLKIFNRETLRDKMVYVRTVQDWKRIYLLGLFVESAES